MFASPLVRNRATVGGNLVDASPAADTAPPLLALGAQVELASVKGTRCVPLTEFFTGVRRTVRRPDELLTRLFWPVSNKRGGAFHKFGLRRADAISVISAAVTAEFNGDGRAHAAAIALGAVAPCPIRVAEAETAALRARVDGRVDCGGGAPGGRRTPARSTTSAGSAAYRRHIAEVIVRRLLSQVAPGGSLQ